MFENYDEYCKHYGADADEEYEPEDEFGDRADIAWEASKVEC